MSRMAARLSALEKTMPREEQLYDVHLIGPDVPCPEDVDPESDVVTVIRLVPGQRRESLAFQSRKSGVDHG